MRVFAFYIIVFLSSIVFAHAQNTRITTYHVDHGLPTNLTKSIIQDELGFVWIGTDMGLIRFDGKNIQHYDNELPSKFVKSFFKRRNGDLLVVTDNGISKIINRIDTVLFNTIIKGGSTPSDSTIFFPKTNAVYEDHFDNLWISEPNAIVLYRNNKIKRYQFPKKDHTASYLRSFTFSEDGFGSFMVVSEPGSIYAYDPWEDKFTELLSGNPNSKVGGFLKLSAGHFWIAKQDGIFELKTNNNKEILSFEQKIAINTASFLCKDHEGTFYIGTWNEGLFKATLKGENVQLSKIAELPFKVINFIHVNNENEIWVSADEGIALLQTSFFSQLKANFRRPFIQSIAQGKGKIYISDGASILEIKKQKSAHVYKERLSEWSQGDILSLARNGKHIWFGTSKGALYKLLENGSVEKIFQGKNEKPIYYITSDKDNNIWFCIDESNFVTKVNQQGEVKFYDNRFGVHSFPVIIKETQDGKIYCGANGKDTYLYEYDKENDRFKNISKPLPANLKNNFTVEDLQSTPSGQLWLGSNQGLLYFSEEGVTQHPFSQKNPFEGVKALALDHNGQLWFGTNLGVHKQHQDHFSLFDESNGLTSKTISYRNIIFDESNFLWIGTASGVGYSHITDHEMKITPKPVFLSLKVNGIPVGIEQPIYKNGSYLEAEFVSLSFPADEVNYQYRLKGLYDNWNTLGQNSKLMIPSIPDGDYILEIKALKQGEYLWSQPLSFAFTINIAWYLTWKAFGGYIIGLSLLVWGLVKFNTHRLYMEKQNLEKIISQRTAEILNQKEEIIMQRDAIEEKNLALEKALNKINKQNDKLKELNVTKDKFFSIIAHDLKGPLNSLSSFSDLLANYTDAMSVDEIKTVAKDLNKNVKNTINLTENLLTWARSQMNKLNFEIQEIDLNKLIKQNIDLLDSIAKSKNIDLKSKLEPGIIVKADEHQLRFIIRNLINNAIKFTHEGGKILVRSQIAENKIEVSIIDSGVGIAKEIKNNIFNLENNNSTPGTAGEKGTGLGLILCKEFIEKNKGKIRLESEEGKGSTFTITMDYIRLEELSKVKNKG
jgi:signal transduction histidine kinase/ligand-binding sensor domain-containing protein